MDDNISERLKGYETFAICPEMESGLPCPRSQAEIETKNGDAVLDGSAKVRDSEGRDITTNFLRGAQVVLNLAISLGIRKAVLKDKSPSCGVKCIYVGGILCPGMGVTAALLERHGVEVISSE